MQPRSVAREIALLVLGQISDSSNSSPTSYNLDDLLSKVLDTLIVDWREGLDSCAEHLGEAQQNLLDSELQDSDKSSIVRIRNHLKTCLASAEDVLNDLSSSLDFPRLVALSNYPEIHQGALQRVELVIQKRTIIDSRLDDVMEGWRLHRLPRVDRDILRLAVVDLTELETPIAVACNEAVDLANRYSDEQGRKMINGILRRLQNSYSSSII